MALRVEKISEEQHGPIRTTLLAYGSALKLLKPAERLETLRLSVDAGGTFWVHVFLPKRFTNYVLQAPFNYDCGGRYDNWKKAFTGENLPNVFTGRTREGAIRGAAVDPRATKAAVSVRIKIPLTPNDAGFQYARTAKAKVTQYIATIPHWEVKRVAETIEAALRNQLESKRDRPDVTAAVPTTRTIPRSAERRRAPRETRSLRSAA